jgi:hypothetical protein
LNVELVYCILKGITKFGYLTLTGLDQDVINQKLAKLHVDENAEDPRLTFNKIKIKNTSEWSEEKYQEFLDGRLKSVNQEPSQMTTLNYRVSVTFHCMKYFKELYGLWQIDDFANFYASLSPKYNRDKIFNAGEGAGRSGSFFFFSHDDKFVVKTVTKDELDLVKRMMPQYSEHLKRNRNSLLSKILGLFTVDTSKFSSVHIMLMENTVRLKDPKRLKFKFDLKGSTVDRLVTGRTYKSTILKDVNFLLVKQTFKELTKLDNATRKRLLKVLNCDIEFLQGLNLMDYSLLVAIEKCPNSKRELHIEKFEGIELNEGFLQGSARKSEDKDGRPFLISTDFVAASMASWPLTNS